MPFDAREVVAASADDHPPFAFTGLDGNTYELPNAKALSLRQAERIQEDPRAVLEEINPQAFEALVDMPMYAWEQFGESWLEHAGDLGKSGSPSSPNRAARRSKRTSSSAASG